MLRSKEIKTLVYFISRESGGPIKIGYTAGNPYHRMSDLQTSIHEKLVILGVVKGDKMFEKSLHRMFSPYRVSGEWFERSPFMMDFLKRESIPIDRIYKMSRNPGQSKQMWRGSKGGVAKGVSAWRERNDIAPEWLVRNVVAMLGAKRTAALLENKISASTLGRKYRAPTAA